MNLGFTVSQHVINTINALPVSERAAVATALTCEFMLGEDPTKSLSPLENMLYTIIRFYVVRDRERGVEAC